MTPNPTLPSHPATRDGDIAEQARPGHGVPSQDPDPNAQIPLGPKEAARESRSVLTGGGAVGGAAIGASIGVAMSGPVGVVVGGTLGAVAGALGAAAAGAAMNTENPSGPVPVVEGLDPVDRGDRTPGAGKRLAPEP